MKLQKKDLYAKETHRTWLAFWPPANISTSENTVFLKNSITCYEFASVTTVFCIYLIDVWALIVY